MDDEQDFLNSYYKDILLISKILHKDKTEENEIEDEEKIYKYCDKEKYFNKKGTKILNEKDFDNIISILYEYIKIDDYIFLLLEKMDIYLIKVVINGYINFSIKTEEQKNKILFIIQNLIPLMLKYEYVYFIYNKLSKIFRLKLKNGEDKEKIKSEFEKFCKIFEIWKMLFNYGDESKANEKYIQLFGNNNIIFKINSTDEKNQGTTIKINMVKSPLLNINIKNEDFTLIKIYNSKDEYFELNLKDIIQDENSIIYSIECIIENNKLFYIINNEKENKKEKDMGNIDGQDIKKIEILKNFYGKLYPIQFMRKFERKLFQFYSIDQDKKNITIKSELKKETFDDNYQNLTKNDKWDINENIEINFENNDFIIMKNYPEKIELLNNIKYFGGFEAFFPIFKILNYFSKYIENKNIIVSITLDIVETIINKIHTSKENLQNFYGVIIPLTAALKTVLDDLSDNEKDIIFKNNIMNLLYLYILTAPITNLEKDIYKSVMHITNEVLLPIIDYDDKIFEQNLSKVISLGWYCFILFIHFEINLLVYNDINKVPKNIFVQFSKIINSVLSNLSKFDENLVVNFQVLGGIMNYLHPIEMEGINKFQPIREFSGVITGASEQRNNLAFFCLYILKILFKLKDLNLIKNLNKGSFYSKLNEIFLDVKNIFKISETDKEEMKKSKLYLKNIYINHLKYYPKNKDYILKIFEKNEKIDFITDEEIQISQFIDYKRQYRKILKEQFSFNNFWSNKELFFSENGGLGKFNLKFKHKNYYTTNFQRPIISPILDYKYQYPSFSKYSIENGFYSIEENEDDYNFNLENKQFDEFLEKTWNINLGIIQSELNKNAIVYDACLIKQSHHIKGKIFLEKKEKIKYFYFVSYSFGGLGKAPTCNSDEKNKNLCYGSCFPCPEKDCFIKIKIEVKDIRFIVKRVYFYRKSGIEIFTNNKSYYFNFAENPSMKNYQERMAENNCNEFLYKINESFKHKYFPLVANNEVFGYINLYSEDFFDKNGNIKKSKKKTFYEHILRHWRDKDSKYSKHNTDISAFDLIILLNLISNRSYIDLNQYPIFPVLHLCDKKMTQEKDNEVTKKSYDLLQRNLTKHIGFQTETEKGKSRCQGFFELYKSNVEDKQNDEENKEEPYYFNTHYSNEIYVSNFFLRLFPYSFIAIECQGDGFDNPDRLFSSIETSFYILSYLKSDIRELIPEFYYFPEMMFNLNKLKFEQKSNGDIIDNVVMPKEFCDMNNKGEIYGIFKYIEFMKNSLEKESKLCDIYSWIKLIFGTGQLYNDNKKKDLLFRPESYMTLDDKILDKYLKDKANISSIDFGLIPLQILNKESEIKIDKKKPSMKKYEKNEIEKRINKNEKSFLIELKEIKNDYNTNINKEYDFIDNNNLPIKILTNSLGKIEIYIDDIFTTEYYNQKDEIKYIDYNKRLNMFITTGLDGYSCLYSFPNKLLNVLKHPNKGYFDYILLGSNPFPFIVAYDKINQEFYSYSINGIFITKIKIAELIQNVDEIKIYPMFDTNGGTHKDILIFNYEKNIILVNLPFFEIEK